MLSLSEWLKVKKRMKKKKENGDEPRGNQTHGEGGNLHQQGQATRGNPQSPNKQFTYSQSPNSKLVTVVVAI